MSKRRVKNYWYKTKEKFTDSAKAKERQGMLRAYASNQVAHVMIDREDGVFYVRYSVANWFKQECEKAGVTL